MSILGKNRLLFLLTFVPKFIRQDFLRKLAAVLLTTLIFVYFYAKESKSAGNTTFTDVPVNVTVPEGYDWRIVPKKVAVELQRGLAAPKSISQSDIRVNLIPSIRQGQTLYKIKLDSGRVSSPVGTYVTAIIPGEITLEVEKKETRKVKVIPDLSGKGNLPEDYTIVKAQCFPGEVELSGPSRLLPGEIFTIPIPFDSSITRSFTYPAELRLPPNSKISASPGDVYVQIEIETSIAKKVIRNIPVKLLAGSRIETKVDMAIVSRYKSVDVTVTGLKRNVENLSASDFFCYADVSRLGEGVHNKVPVHVQCRTDKEGVRIHSFLPGSIDIRVGYTGSSKK